MRSVERVTSYRALGHMPPRLQIYYIFFLALREPPKPVQHTSITILSRTPRQPNVW